MSEDHIRALVRSRWCVALILGGIVFAMYFGFILAVAFGREIMALEIVPGLSLGILAGALVIVGAWLSTWAYVRWANRHFDVHLGALTASAPRRRGADE